ncbi:MAG: hypothetical protein KDB22_05365 [Planctomycetales bacterium]|nr:hypothetical protein [Planctomycetales bacterium]
MSFQLNSAKRLDVEYENCFTGIVHASSIRSWLFTELPRLSSKAVSMCSLWDMLDQKYVVIRLLALIVVVQIVGLAVVATQLSPTPDEFPNLVAGLSYLQSGRYDLYSVNPPPIKVVAALPAQLAGFRVPKVNLEARRPEFEAGLDFWREHGSAAEWQLVFSRWICSLFSVFGTLGVFRLSLQMSKCRVALLASLFWALSPLVLAYGPLISFDVASCTAVIWATSMILDWVRYPNFTNSLAAGISMGLAVSIKSSCLVLFLLLPIWSALAVVARNSCDAAEQQKCSRSRLFLSIIPHSLLIVATGLIFLNMCYRFQDSFAALGAFKFQSQLLGGKDVGQRDSPYANRFADRVYAYLPIPVPTPFVAGIDLQKRDFEQEHPAYRWGKIRRRGIWYFYAFGYAHKLPIGILCLLPLGLFRLFKRWESCLGLILIPSVFFLLISSQTGMNDHFRYAVIFLGQLLIVAAIGLDFLLSRSRYLLAGICGLSIISAPLAYFPFFQAYTNEISGGTYMTAERVGANTVDWYQGWWAAREFIDARLDAGETIIVFQTRWIEPLLSVYERLPLQQELLPERLTLILPTTARQLELSGSTTFSQTIGRPVATIAGGVEIYGVSPAQVNELNRLEFYSLRRSLDSE